jgi:hypothetical protein
MDRFRDSGSTRRPVERAGTKDGLATIPSYISRMFQSLAKRPQVSVFCWQHSDKHLLSVICPKGVLHVIVLLKCAQPPRERAIRGLFAEAGITPIQDELTGETGDQSRFLLYPLPAFPDQAASLIQHLLQKGYGINYDSELEITYRDKDAV